MKGYETVIEKQKNSGEYINRYYDIRELPSLDGNTPLDVYFGRVKLEKID